MSSLAQYLPVKNRLAFSLLAVLLILLIALSFYFKSPSDKDVSLYKKLLSERTKIVLAEEHTRRGSVPEEYKDQFIDCFERAEYDSFINKDSRTLSKKELNRALDLHSKCGKKYLDKKDFSRTFFTQSLSAFFDGAQSFEEKRALALSKESADLWFTDYNLQKELDRIYARFIEIQGSYWTTELKKVSKIISAEEREDAFNTLNNEAYALLDKVKILEKEALAARQAEKGVWEKLSGKKSFAD